MTKARDLSKLLSTANGKIAGANLDVSFENITDTGTEGTRVATGTTAQRGTTQGQLRFNTTTGLAEYYTGSEFKAIDTPPTITSVDVTNVETDLGGTQTFVITGSLFSGSATVKFRDNGGTLITPDTTTVNSASQITVTKTRSSFSNANEPYDVIVTNPSGLEATLDNAINVDNTPVWSTTSGQILELASATAGSTTVSATDSDGDTISYSVSSGALPTGMTLTSGNGVISGTAPNDSTDTTYNFNITASALTKSASRAFSIKVVKIDGTSRTKALTVSNVQNPITVFLNERNEVNGSATSGVYWFKTTNSANETYLFPTVITNFNSNTWIMLTKNFRPHAYKDYDSDSNTSGGTINDNNSAHSLSYGLIASDGSALVTAGNILGNASNTAPSSSTLGTYHCAVAVKSFGDNVWTQTCFHGRDGGYRYLTRNDLTDKIHKGQNPANGLYEDNTWYSPSSGSNFMYFNTRLTTEDRDTMRLGLTPYNNTNHDQYNSPAEHIGTTWFRDGNDDYLNTNKDSQLGGTTGYSTDPADSGYGRISIWLR